MCCIETEKMIYEPAEDSYLLEKYVKIFAKGNVLDLGCGSGIQSLAALSCKDVKKVVGVDINPECIEYCKKNIPKAEFIVSDLFSNVKGKFDLIIFNPPYLPKDSDEDSESALITTGGYTGIELLDRFLKEVGHFLNFDGKILIVVSSLTGDVDSLIKKYNFKFKILEKQKVFFEELKVYILDCVA